MNLSSLKDCLFLFWNFFFSLLWYLIGARYYDPELGVWLSVDPAEEYWNSYLYCGADPNNYIDPFGLWTFGLGLLFGYTKEGGFSLGFGITGDFGQGAGNLSWQYNFGNDSHTFSAGVGGQGDYVHGNAGYTYNTESGHAINASAGGQYYFVGGESVFQTSWDTDGNYLGGSFGQRGFLGASGLNIGGGYQWGWGQYEDGWFGDYSAVGFNGRWDKNGYTWGAQANFNVVSYSNDNTEYAKENYANLYTDESGYSHNGIKGMYKGNPFKITVGTSEEVAKKYMSGCAEGGNSCRISGRSTRLRGANISTLYHFSKLIDAMDKKGILKYNAFLLNCSRYTSIAMNLAGVNNKFMISPYPQGWQIKGTKGWGF